MTAYGSTALLPAIGSHGCREALEEIVRSTTDYSLQCSTGVSCAAVYRSLGLSPSLSAATQELDAMNEPLKRESVADWY